MSRADLATLQDGYELSEQLQWIPGFATIHLQ
jgi:hypothetical protein